MGVKASHLTGYFSDYFFNQKFVKVYKKPIQAPHYVTFSVRNPPPSTMARDSPHTGPVMQKVLPCHDVMNWKLYSINAVFWDCYTQSLTPSVLPQIALINVLSVAKMAFVELLTLRWNTPETEQVSARKRAGHLRPFLPQSVRLRNKNYIPHQFDI